MSNIIVPIIIAIVSSNALFGFIQFIINKKDNIVKDIKYIREKVDYVDQGQVRTQLLVLIANYPDRIEEIMKLAEQYFCKFHGNYYLTSLFKKYLDDKMLTYPQWFNTNNH